MLHIVATQVKHGRGGISTALVGFTESPQLQAHGFNIIESHGSGGRWQAFRRAVRQIRTDVKPGDTVWLHCGPWLSMLRKGYLARVAKQQGAQILIHLHSPRTENLLHSGWGRALLRWLFKPADHIIVLTPWWHELLHQSLPHLNKPIAVIPNPLGEQFEALAEEPMQPSTSQHTTLLSMARLVPEKGVADVIRALPLLPDSYRLVIAGDGPQRPELEQLARQLGCEQRIEFRGWVDYNHKVALLREADIFCLPSRYDSFGMGFIEAMAAGLPVVAFDLPAIRSVVLHESTGYLVPNISPSALAQAVLIVTATKTEQGAAAKVHVLSHFSSQTAVQSLLKLF